MNIRKGRYAPFFVICLKLHVFLHKMHKQNDSIRYLG